MALSADKVLFMLLARAATSSSFADARLDAADVEGDLRSNAAKHSMKGVSLIQSGSKVMSGLHDLHSDPFSDLDDDFDAPKVSFPSADLAVGLQDVIDANYWSAFFLDLAVFAGVIVLGRFFYAMREGSKKGAEVKAKLRATSSCPPSTLKKCEGNKPVDFGQLMKAAKTGDERSWRSLLQEIPDVASAEDLCGCTALHVAAHAGSVAMVQDLIARGVDVNAKEAWEETPLHVAARQGAVGVCRLLLQNGAELNPTDGSDRTPLLSAAHAGQESACEFLLDEGADCGGAADSDLPPLLSTLLLCRMIAPTREQ